MPKNFSIWYSINDCVKVELIPSKNIYFTYFNETPLKMMKNVFYFIFKTLFVLKIFKFLSWFFGIYISWPISQEVKAIRQWNLVSSLSNSCQHWQLLTYIEKKHYHVDQKVANFDFVWHPSPSCTQYHSTFISAGKRHKKEINLLKQPCKFTYISSFLQIWIV